MTCGLAACYAASPLTMRKGSAFPWSEDTNQSPPRRLKGEPSGGAEEEKTREMGRKGGAFPHNGAAEPH
jgi:hypothetical protein